MVINYGENGPYEALGQQGLVNEGKNMRQEPHEDEMEVMEQELYNNGKNLLVKVESKLDELDQAGNNGSLDCVEEEGEEEEEEEEEDMGTFKHKDDEEEDTGTFKSEDDEEEDTGTLKHEDDEEEDSGTLKHEDDEHLVIETDPNMFVTTGICSPSYTGLINADTQNYDSTDQEIDCNQEKSQRSGHSQQNGLEEQCICIKFCFKLGKTPRGTYEMLKDAFGDNMDRSQTYEWFSRFKSGVMSVDDSGNSGQPLTNITDVNVEKVCQTICQDPRLTMNDICSIIGLSLITCQHIITNQLNLMWIITKFVPRLLSQVQKQRRFTVCRTIQQEIKNNKKFLSNVIAGDTCWVYGYDPEISEQSSELDSPDLPLKKKIKLLKINIKIMIICFFDNWGIVHEEFVPVGSTVNQHFYIQVLNRLMEEVKRKRPELCHRQNWVLYHDNVLAHTALRDHEFMAKNNITIIPHLPYSPDLSPFDFFLVPKMKSRLKGQRLNNIKAIETESCKILNSIPQIQFHRCFQQWEKRLTNCIASQGDYLRGESCKPKSQKTDDERATARREAARFRQQARRLKMSTSQRTTARQADASRMRKARQQISQGREPNEVHIMNDERSAARRETERIRQQLRRQRMSEAQRVAIREADAARQKEARQHLSQEQREQISERNASRRKQVRQKLSEDQHKQMKDKEGAQCRRYRQNQQLAMFNTSELQENGDIMMKI